MNHSRTYRWARRAVWGTLAMFLSVGCDPLTTAAFLFHHDAKEPAQAPLKFTEGAKKDKEEIVVAIFVSQGSGQSYSFAGVQDILASEMAKKFPEVVKENKDWKQKIRVVPSKDVNAFKMRNPTWATMHPSKWGKQLGADFVLDIHLDQMRLYQPSTMMAIYEGRAEVSVDTYDVDAGLGEPKYNYVYPFSFPKTGYRDASAIPEGTFRKQFIETLALELCRQHVDHNASSGIAE